MNYLSGLESLLRLAGLPAVATAVENLALGWVAIAAALVGAAASYDSSKRNQKTAEKANSPQPFWQESESGPPDWLAPYIRDATHSAQDIYNQRIENPWLPPTFNQVAGGLRGKAPGFPSYTPNPRPDDTPTPGPGPGSINDSEGRGDILNDPDKSRSKYSEIAGRPGGVPGGYAGLSGGLGELGERPGGSGRPGGLGGSGGGRGGRGGTSSIKDLLAQHVLARATRERDPSVQGSLDFLSRLQGGQGPAFRQQTQTYGDIRSQDSPLNRLLAQGMSGGGLNRSTPYQTSFMDALMSKFSRPETRPRTQRFGDLMGMMQGDPFYDTKNAGR